MAAFLRSFAREPLVHFLVLGTLLFGLDHAVAGRRDASVTSPDALERRIVVDDAVRRGLLDDWAHQHDAEPSDEELHALVAQYVDDEILYREGLSRGLAEGDARVRARVASLMAHVLDAEQAAPEATDAELRAYFDAHRERYGQAARIDFVHVFVEGDGEEAEARARELLSLLESGASPAGLGDTFSGGRHYRARRLADLEAAFGPAFAAGLDTAPEGAWSLRRSRFGLHLVRVERRTTASDADFDAAQLDVARDRADERQQDRMRRAMEALRTRWEIVER